MAEPLNQAAQLHQAVRLRHYRRARQLLENGTVPSAPDAQGRTPMHTAAAQSDARMLALLLRHSNDTDAWQAPDPCGMTPLHLAASRRKGAACAAMLLDRGAAPDVPGPFGVTPRLCAHTFAYRDTEAIVTKHGGSLTRGVLSEISFRSLLAHLFGIGGATLLHGRRIALEAAYPEATFGLLGDAVAAYRGSTAFIPADFIPLLETAAGALREASENIGAPAGDLYSRIQAGQTTVLPCGVPLHCAAIVWSGGQTFWCDRLRRPTVREVNFRLTAGRLHALARSGVRWHPPGLVWSTWLRFGPLGCLPGRRPSSGHCPKPQHVGNCAMASAKAALWALLAQQSQTDDATLHQRYKALTTYARYHYLHAYIMRHLATPTCPFDASLVHRCLTKLYQASRRAYLDAKQVAAISDEAKNLYRRHNLARHIEDFNASAWHAPPCTVLARTA